MPFFAAEMGIYYQYIRSDSAVDNKPLQPNTSMHCLSTIEPSTRLTLG